MKDKIKVKVPFSGFYDSHYLQQFRDYRGYLEDDEQTEDLARFKESVVRDHCALLSEYYNTPVVFHKTTICPETSDVGVVAVMCREYLDKLVTLAHEHPKLHRHIQRRVRERLTAYEGFAPVYSSDLSKWPKTLGKLDDPQIDLLLEASWEYVYCVKERMDIDEYFNLGIELETRRTNDSFDLGKLRPFCEVCCS